VEKANRNRNRYALIFEEKTGDSFYQLEEIISINKIYSPAKVLKLLHEKTNQSVNKHAHHSYGMDIALCVIEATENTEKYTIRYAGAKSPLLYSLPNYKELHEIKPNRTSVAILSRKNVIYLEHQLVLPKNTIIYLFSDGYIDQCNVQRNRLGTRNLKTLLANDTGASLAEKQKLLEYELDSYQLGADQRDDILVCGFRI
jgi:serine phosphatase RsbU (regulator of sigma subunit)